MKAKPLGLRLFLEGVEVPVISAQVLINQSQPASASVQIVPTNAALELKPRTLVHLFYLDRISQVSGPERSKQERLEEQYKIAQVSDSVFSTSESSYKLLFSGEVVGISFSKTPTSRAVILQCLDLSSYWDVCYQWFADWSGQCPALFDKSHNFVGAKSGLFNNIASGTRWVTANILQTKPKSPKYKDCQGLLGGVISLIESIGGLRGSGGGYRGVSDFFTIADRRYNFMGMLGAIPGDTTSVKLYSYKSFMHWLENGMTSYGNLISFRDVLRQVGQYIFHDVYPNPVAYLAPSSEVSTASTTHYATSSLVTNLLKGVLSDLQSLDTELSVLKKYVGSKVAVPVVLEEASRPFLPDNDRGQLEVLSAIPNVLRLLQCVATALDDVVATGLEMKDLDKNSVADLSSAAAHFRSYGRQGSEENSLTIFTDTTSEEVAHTRLVVNRCLTGKSTKKTHETGEHLYNQLFLPEAYMVVPPVCNTMFPDQVTEMTYSRNFLREVTRLSCQGGLGILGRGDSRFLGYRYFSPTVKDANGNSLVKTLQSGGQVLLPHEIHSGIIPKFEWVTDGHRWASSAAKGEKSIPYVQKLANFQFFMHRWASRAMHINGHFNPYLVLGFPSVVLDRSSPTDAALSAMASVLGKAVLPTQFIGKITGISHTVNQKGGYTSVDLNYCRTHRGLDDEYLGVLDPEASDFDNEKAAVSSKTYSFNPLSLSKIFEGATLSDTDRATYKKILGAIAPYLFAVQPSSQQVETDQGPQSLEGTSQLIEEDIGTFSSDQVVTRGLRTLAPGVFPDIHCGAAAYGKDKSGISIKTVEVGDVGVFPDSVRMELGITVYNQSLKVPSSWSLPDGTTLSGVHWFIPTDITVKVNQAVLTAKQPSSSGKERTPPEKVMLPAWYSKDIWTSENIGKKVYKPLLGCGAMTDSEGFISLMDEIKGRFPIDVSAEPTLEKAIDGLSVYYGLLVEQGLSVSEFIQTFTHRPVATLPEVIGGILPDGSQTQGFHGNAFGDYNSGAIVGHGKPGRAMKGALHGLFGEQGTEYPRMYTAGGTEKNPEIPPYLDPRGNSRARVRAYLAELKVSRGLRGS